MLSFGFSPFRLTLRRLVPLLATPATCDRGDIRCDALTPTMDAS